ncbi:hypothetical protein N6H14_28660 [Paenibacillus sp. CC-CFT747]|nr:hypothetical protein N6H14_28660 [Paenibacillus sp. CC-CFT747]
MANHKEADFGEPEERKGRDNKESLTTDSMGPKWTRRSLLTSMGLTGAALLVGSALGRTEARASETSPSPSPSASTPSTTAAETAGSVPQADYVELLRDHNDTPATLYAKITGDRKLEVLIPFKGNRCAHYALSKDPNDDFIKLMNGSVSVLEESYNLIGAADYASKTGTWVTNFPPNEYTTEIGASFTFTFEGTGFDFQHYTDNRGGIWEFTVDGQAPLRISTHVDAVPAGQIASNVATRPVARGLALASHTVVAVFQGDDPAHPPPEGRALRADGSAVPPIIPTKATLTGLLCYTATSRLLRHASCLMFSIRGVTRNSP